MYGVFGAIGEILTSFGNDRFSLWLSVGVDSVLGDGARTAARVHASEDERYYSIVAQDPAVE